MVENYANWLVAVYTARFGWPPAEPDAAERAARILRRHAARVPAGDEFVSLVAVETVERLNALDADQDESLLRTLDKAADAARHRVIRETRRWHTNLADVALGQVPTPPPANDVAIERVKAELLDGLSVEEHLIVERLLTREPVGDLAQRLGVSRRTLYRRLKVIEDRIGGMVAEG